MTIFFEKQRQDWWRRRRVGGGVCLCLRSEFNLVLAAASFGNFHGIQSTNVGLRRFFICFDVICNFHLPRSKEIVECEAIISGSSSSELRVDKSAAEPCKWRQPSPRSQAISRTYPSPFPFPIPMPNPSPICSSCSHSLIFLFGSQCLAVDGCRPEQQVQFGKSLTWVVNLIFLPGINKYLMEAAAHYASPSAILSAIAIWNEVASNCAYPVVVSLEQAVRQKGRLALPGYFLPRMQIGEINIAQAADWHKQLRLACQLDQVQVMLRSTFHSAVSVVVSPLPRSTYLRCSILGCSSACRRIANRTTRLERNPGCCLSANSELQMSAPSFPSPIIYPQLICKKVKQKQRRNRTINLLSMMPL